MGMNQLRGDGEVTGKRGSLSFGVCKAWKNIVGSLEGKLQNLSEKK